MENMTLAEAQEELVTVNAALSEYYTGTRRVRFTVWSAGNKKDYQFSDPNKLFDYLVERRKELLKFIAQAQSPSIAVPTFARNANIPIVFRR